MCLYTRKFRPAYPSKTQVFYLTQWCQPKKKTKPSALHGMFSFNNSEIKQNHIFYILLNNNGPVKVKHCTVFFQRGKHLSNSFLFMVLTNREYIKSIIKS